MMDILGKGRYYYYIFTNEDMAYTMNVGNFLPIKPDLINRYSETDKVVVGCRPNINYRVTDMKIADNPFVIQIPMRCDMVVSKTGEEFYSATVVYRANYKPMVTAAGGLYAVLHNVKVHYVVPNYFAEVNTQMEASEILDKTSLMFEGKSLLDPATIIVPVPRMTRYRYEKMSSDNEVGNVCLYFSKYTLDTQ